jgi:hypothetical protein
MLGLIDVALEHAVGECRAARVALQLVTAIPEAEHRTAHAVLAQPGDARRHAEVEPVMDCIAALRASRASTTMHGNSATSASR